MNQLRMFLAANTNRRMVIYSVAAVGTVGAALGIWRSRSNSSQVPPHIRPEGAPKQLSTKLLGMGAKVLQSKKPLRDFDIYLVAFHPMADDPCHQMEAHHYCKQVNEDFAQCILTDSNTEDANITGLEYIISEKLFAALPEEERKFWHPHNYEIFSGMLTAPGLPTFAEKTLLKTKINSYGKTWHTWRAKCWEGHRRYLDTLPLGDVLLGWSFNHDGEIRGDLIAERDLAMNTNMEKNRKERLNLAKYAHDQHGEYYLQDKLRGKEKKTQHPVEGDQEARRQQTSDNQHGEYNKQRDKERPVEGDQEARRQPSDKE